MELELKLDQDSRVKAILFTIGAGSVNIILHLKRVAALRRSRVEFST